MASVVRGAAGHRFQVCLMGGCCWSARWHVKTVLISQEQDLNTVVLVWTKVGLKAVYFGKEGKNCFKLELGVIWNVPFLFLQSKIWVSWGKSEEEPFSLITRSNLVSSFFLVLCWLCIHNMSVSGHWFAVIQPLLLLARTYEGFHRNHIFLLTKRSCGLGIVNLNYFNLGYSRL